MGSISSELNMQCINPRNNPLIERDLDEINYFEMLLMTGCLNEITLS